jgi:acyl-coenzyme A thioesterase PaaI-like protein
MTRSAARAPSPAYTRQRLHPRCFVCQPDRPFGLRVPYAARPDGVTIATVECPRDWEGYPGLVHGGIIASLLDGAMTNCLFNRDVAAVTADLHVRYRHPVAIGERAEVRAEMTRRIGPLFVLEATIYQRDRLCTKGNGRFMEQRSAWAPGD